MSFSRASTIERVWHAFNASLGSYTHYLVMPYINTDVGGWVERLSHERAIMLYISRSMTQGQSTDPAGTFCGGCGCSHA